jgi:tetratricopeptide (TPR) repeat protein
MTTPEPPLDRETLDRVRQITLEVLRTVGESKPTTRKRWRRMVVDFLSRDWVPVGAIVLALIGWRCTKASPIASLKEVADRQSQREARQEVVKRHNSLGNKFLSLGQFEAARSEFEQASVLEPANPDAQLGGLKASVFDSIESNEYDPEIAGERLRFIRSLHEDDTHALTLLGQLYLGTDLDSAFRFYKLAIASDKDNALAYAGMGEAYRRRANADTGDVYRRRGHIDSGFAMDQSAHTISPWNQGFLNNLAYQQYLRGDYWQADTSYRALLKLNDRYLLSAYMLANTELMMHEAANAHTILRILVVDALRDSVRMHLPQNLRGWAFVVDSLYSQQELHTPQEKAVYAYSLMAMSAYMSDSVAKAHRHVRELGQFNVPWLLPVETIIRADLHRLRKEWPERKSKVDRLETLIWTEGFRQRTRPGGNELRKAAP